MHGWLTLTVFLVNITCCACLERSGLKFIFHLYAQWEIFFRSCSSWLAEILGSYIVENKDVSSSNSFTVACKFSGRSFMYIKKSNGPKIKPCRNPASTDDQLKHCWQLSTTRWNLLLKKLLSRLRRFTEIPIRSSVNSNPSCYTLSKAFEIFKKLVLIPRVGCWSKLAYYINVMNDW